MANGDVSPTLMSCFIMFVMASVYAFFNPTRVTGVEALQSNGAMLTLMGASTLNMVSGGGSMTFFMLYCLLSLDCMASFSQFFSEHSEQVEWGGPADPLRVIIDPKGGSNDGDYSRL